MVKDVRDDKGNDDGRSSSPWSGDSKLGVSNLLGIVRLFVLHLPKMNSKQYRICTAVRNGPGGI
ncbi:MAG TPA: hypothetical protein VKA09_04595 [Nitrososphaeraceae archaeon]|nr:hypothetical protein [Nitrososphaeraceae archaeon]